MSRKTLNTTNLAALGPQRLAALLMEVSTGSADIKRRLRLELSHNLGASELAEDVRKRLITLRKSRTYVGWRKRKALIKDLNLQVAMIVEKIAADDPTAAFDLLWQFIEIAPSVFVRLDDSRGDVGDVFRAAIAHFDDIAQRAVLTPDDVADRVWAALQDNDYGEWDGIIAHIAPALGEVGLARLRALVEAFGATPVSQADSDDHDAIRFLRELRGGEDRSAALKARFVKECLQEIAAVAGDTAAYIAQYSPQDRKRKKVAAEIAFLLLEDGQPDAALDLLLDASQAASGPAQRAWDEAYIACLTVLGRSQEAQAHRWACFTTTLRTAPLRDYLAQLPDFEDVDAQDQARRHVLAAQDFSAALAFCLEWPDPVTAAALIEARLLDEKGDHPALFIPAVDVLRLRHPRAAALLLRAMIDTALSRNQVARFGVAAEYLADCAALDADIQDYGPFETHVRYVTTLQKEFGHVAAFWKHVI